ncbi:MAG: ribonuclease P protein component [Firmicutes bacterium]|nr:ribonuclease P protein component [Bacillota bacterium]
MLKKQYRLKKRKSFNYIHRRGKHIGNDTLSMSFVYARMKDSPLKIGFSVSKKVGNSVIRNRAIRKMRHAAKNLTTRVKPDHSIIFVAKEGIDKKRLTEIIKAMENVLQRGGLLL